MLLENDGFTPCKCVTEVASTSISLRPTRPGMLSSSNMNVLVGELLLL